MTSKEKLPAGIKVIGIIGCLAGGWNTMMGILASFMALSAEIPADPNQMTLTQMPAMKIFFPVVAIIAFIILISSIGLLRRKAWGRYAVLTTTVFVVLGFIAYLVSSMIQMQANESIPFIAILIPIIIACVMIGVPSAFIVWYLNKKTIREIYK